jgi:STE24 endopeptidase
MQPFDPAAAAHAYVAVMTPAQMAKAVAYTHGREWMRLWGWLVSLVVAWLIVRAGVTVKIRDMLDRDRRRPFLSSLAIIPVYILIASLLSLPWSIYSGWWFQKQYDLTSQPLSGWLQDQLIGLGFGLVQGLIFWAALYTVMRLAKRSWPLWCGVVAAALLGLALFLQPLVIEPAFNTYKPAPPGPVRDVVVQLGKETGTPTDKIFIYNGSKQSNAYTANVAGMFGTARVALSDTMFKRGSSISEIRAVVGHEMGHYVHAHSLWFIGIAMVLGAIAFWLMGLFFPLFRGVLGAKGVGAVSDPAGLPVLAVSFFTVALLGTPVLNTISRYTEADADSFSLAHAHEPDGLSTALVKTAEYRAPMPSQLEETIFYDHPSVYNRVKKAMDWKAAHMAETEATEARDAEIEKQAAAAPAPK